MNLLSHAFIAYKISGFENTAFLLGNVMADYCTGIEIQTFPLEIQKGIQLHRHVDSFTDGSLEYKELSAFLRENGAPRHGSGILVDIFWDYILAKNWAQFESTNLVSWSQEAYIAIESQKTSFSPVFSQLFPWIKSENWFASYGEIAGIKRTIARIASRIRHGEAFLGTEELLISHFKVIEENFRTFWPKILQSAIENTNSEGNF